MTYKLYLGVELREMPTAFQNLYHSLGRQCEYKFHTINRYLETEPYTAVLYESRISSYRNKDWWMEFASEEDYIAFLVKWS